MIVKEEFLSKLRRYFSLNLYEVKVWAALLSRGVSTAGELSDIANVPRSRSYDVLESLEKKGFVVMKIGKPIKYIAVPPQEVLERVKTHVKDNADEQVKKLESLKETVVEIKDRVDGHDDWYRDCRRILDTTENQINTTTRQLEELTRIVSTKFSEICTNTAKQENKINGNSKTIKNMIKIVIWFGSLFTAGIISLICVLISQLLKS